MCLFKRPGRICGEKPSLGCAKLFHDRLCILRQDKAIQSSGLEYLQKSSVLWYLSFKKCNCCWDHYCAIIFTSDDHIWSNRISQTWGGGPLLCMAGYSSHRGAGG